MLDPTGGGRGAVIAADLELEFSPNCIPNAWAFDLNNLCSHGGGQIRCEGLRNDGPGREDAYPLQGPELLRK